MNNLISKVHYIYNRFFGKSLLQGMEINWRDGYIRPKLATAIMKNVEIDLNNKTIILSHPYGIVRNNIFIYS